MYVLELPLWVRVKKSEKTYINLNGYRNWHYRLSNDAKILFKEAVKPQIDRLPVMDRVEIHYTYFAPTNQLTDTANIVSIVDKFFCDALVECGKLLDDHRLIVVETRQRFGGVDKHNPRVEACVVPVGLNPGSAPHQPTVNPHSEPSREKNMKIQIVQVEIEEAVRQFIANQIQVKDGHVITMKFSATRGEDGLTADIDIAPGAVVQHVPEPVTAPVAAAAPVAQTPKPAASRLKAPTPAPVTATEAAPAIRATPEDRVEVETEIEDLEVSEAERPLKPSIFGNLSRASNVTTEPAEPADA